MITMTHDEAVKLHMGKFEEVKSIMALIESDYQKTYMSKIYRMRAEDIKRAEKYLNEIKNSYSSLRFTLKCFKTLL